MYRKSLTILNIVLIAALIIVYVDNLKLKESFSTLEEEVGGLKRHYIWDLEMRVDKIESNYVNLQMMEGHVEYYLKENVKPESLKHYCHEEELRRELLRSLIGN